MTQCIEAVGSRTSDGYGFGTIAYGHGQGAFATVRAHRVAYQNEVGPIPEGMLVLHTCDNRGCVNPEHLMVGTHGDNVRDMLAKGRGWQQQKTHCPKGHEYTPENTYVRPSRPARRYCRACISRKP